MKEGCTWPTKWPNMCCLSHSLYKHVEKDFFSLVNIYMNPHYFFIQSFLLTHPNLFLHPSIPCAFAFFAHPAWWVTNSHNVSLLAKNFGRKFTFCRTLVFLSQCRCPFWPPSLNFLLCFSFLVISWDLGDSTNSIPNQLRSRERCPLAENVVFEVWIGPASSSSRDITTSTFRLRKSQKQSTVSIAT